jgi:hypothetical protein
MLPSYNKNIKATTKGFNGKEENRKKKKKKKV